MKSDEQDPEEIIEQAKSQDRVSTDPSSVVDDEPADLQTAIREAYERLEDGSLSSNVTMRDGDLAVLFAALSETGDLEVISKEAKRHLDSSRDDNPAAKSTALALLARVGLRELRPDVIETAVEGRKEFVLDRESEF